MAPKKRLPPKQPREQPGQLPEQEPAPQQPAIDPAMLAQLEQAMHQRIAQQQAAQQSIARNPVGMPQPGADMQPEVKGFMPEEAKPISRITQERLNKAVNTLMRYKAGKAHLDSRLIEVEQWWKIRHWEWMQEKGAKDDIKTSSAWLFNVIISKHADGIQSIPEANILPREESDKPTARMLSAIIPCILEQNEFEEEYSDILWQKLKGGTGAYGAFWDSGKLNGLGDISIKRINLLRLYWEPGINDIQDSRNVFHVEQVDIEALKQQYPQLKDMNLTGSMISLRKFITEDPVDQSEKTVVVDWYYHRYDGGKKTLHYCKFVGDTVLYATEDEPEWAERGLYDHGMYPFILDPLFPVEGSPCGFGYIDVCKNAQEQIDILNQALIKNSLVNATPRYFIRSDGSVNEQEFMDFTKPLVHVNGNLGADSLVPITPTSLNGNVIAVVNNKIGELKETSGNTDSSNGITQNSSQAASAIAALQEASGKVSRASTMSAYRAFCRLVNQLIELIRQFYNAPRQFRIMGEMGQEQYMTFDNAAMQPQALGMQGGMDMGMRLPVFDVKVSAQTKNVYSKNSQNELAISLYNLGVFNPQMTDQALMLLDLMDFDDKEKLMQKVSQNGTLMQQMAMYQQIALRLATEHDPQLAQQLAATIMGGAQAGGAPGLNLKPTGDGGRGGNITKLNNARAQAQNAAQPR